MVATISILLLIGALIEFIAVPLFIQHYINRVDKESWRRTIEGEKALYQAITIKKLIDSMEDNSWSSKYD